MRNRFLPGNTFGRTPVPAWERVLSRVEKITETGCWIFMGAVSPTGYGHVGAGSLRDGTRTVISAHRAVFEAFKGPIPKDREVDHLCRVRCCVNPDHLELVTSLENILRGELGTKRRTLKCLRGHDLTDEANVYRSERPGRTRFECRTCLRESDARRKARRNREVSA